MPGGGGGNSATSSGRVIVSLPTYSPSSRSVKPATTMATCALPGSLGRGSRVILADHRDLRAGEGCLDPVQRGDEAGRTHVG